MSTIVSKFGGSSMADAERFRHVLGILSPRRHRQYIILSAPGKRYACDKKITDLLVLAHRLFANGQDGSEPLNTVRFRFTQIIHELRLDIDPVQFLSTLEADVRHSTDQAASRGEYLCARLFAAYASIPFVDAAELIRFDAQGSIQQDQIAYNVCRMARKYPCAVIPGFYGSMPDESIKTFSRGGSDITGALIAAALHADIYENWTDVDGLMSADPSICPDAVCHPAVSYRQMRMLAKSGAQILHPYCVEPVCEAGIPTVLKNTFSPGQPGTYISDHVHRNVPCVCALSGYNAIPIDALSTEGRRIADGLLAERYYYRERELITLKDAGIDSIGTPVTIVSAYGLVPEHREEATRRVCPLGALHSQYCSKYLVLPERAAEAQRILHALTESRIPSDCDEPFRPSP